MLCNNHKNSLVLVGTAIIAILLLLLLLLLPTPAFIGAFSTAAQTVAVGDNVAFNALGPANNTTFTAPDTLTLGANAGGTYLVSYHVSLIGIDATPPLPAAPAAPAAPAGLGARRPAGISGALPDPADPADPTGSAAKRNGRHDPVFGVFVNGVVQPSTQFGAIVADGATTNVTGDAIITIPAGATVTLRNLGPDTANLNNNIGGVTIVSADLNLNRLGT